MLAASKKQRYITIMRKMTKLHLRENELGEHDHFSRGEIEKALVRLRYELIELLCTDSLCSTYFSN